MFDLLRLWPGLLHRFLRSRQSLLIENLALRQQLAVLKRQHSRPRLFPSDKISGLLLLRFWSSWKTVLVVVTPESVVRWHRSGFQLYWRFLSRVRKPVGRSPVTREIRDLIFRMVAENPTWRAPRIHGELVMLGFEISERSVSRWMRRAPRPDKSGQRWLAFLRNHRQAIAGMDFFSVPTGTFNVLYVFFLIGHDRRRILYVNVTRHPTSGWRVQQLREAFPYEPTTKFLLLDHDARYGSEVPDAIRSMNIRSTAVGCSWQNGVVERRVGSCRRRLLDQVIAINELHLKRLLSSYIDYYHQHPLWSPEATSCESNAQRRPRQGRSLELCRWSSPSLRTCCVNSALLRGFGLFNWATMRPLEWWLFIRCP